VERDDFFGVEAEQIIEPSGCGLSVGGIEADSQSCGSSVQNEETRSFTNASHFRFSLCNVSDRYSRLCRWLLSKQGFGSGDHGTEERGQILNSIEFEQRT